MKGIEELTPQDEVKHPEKTTDEQLSEVFSKLDDIYSIVSQLQKEVEPAEPTNEEE